jgi:pyruvate kinase
VQPGDPILLDDGKLRLRVISSGAEDLLARVEHGGPLGEHKGINLPGVKVSAPALTDKDRADLAFGLSQGVDYVALSFVRAAADLHEARRAVEALGGKVPLITKLEKPEAIEQLDAILAASDGVMVARGDLGVELPPERVPMIQKQIIRKANQLGKPVITATQMLESMVNSPTPTRAEASDVANAVWDGTDAVMLSGESAIGRYPVETVQVMDRIIAEAEKQLPRPMERSSTRANHAQAISRAARALAEDLGAVAIACFTRSGRTAQLLSQQRPGVPIYAFTNDPALARRLVLWWAVEPLACAVPPNTDALILQMEHTLLERGLAQSGQSIVIVGAIPQRGDVRTNFLKVHRIG